MTKDELQQMDQLLQKRLEENNLHLREEFKTAIKIEVEPIHERLDAQRDQINDVEKRLTAKISLEINDLVEMVRDAVFPKLDQHDEQISDLQQEAGIKPRKH